MAGTDSRDDLMFYIHSAHDTNTVNALLWLKPMSFNLIESPFASSITFELHYDDTCLSTTKDTSCFTVEISNNGNQLKLDTCVTANKAKGSTSPICQYEDFLRHISARTLKGDLKQLCLQGYDPYPQV